MMAYYDQQLCTIRHVDCRWIFSTADDRYSSTLCDICYKYQRSVFNSALVIVNIAD